MSELPVNGKCPLESLVPKTSSNWRLEKNRTHPLSSFKHIHYLAMYHTPCVNFLEIQVYRQVYTSIIHVLISYIVLAKGHPCGSTAISTGSEPSCSRLVVKLRLFKGPPNLQEKRHGRINKPIQEDIQVIFTTWNFKLIHPNFSFLGLKYCWWLKSCIVYLKYLNPCTSWGEPINYQTQCLWQDVWNINSRNP